MAYDAGAAKILADTRHCAHTDSAPQSIHESEITKLQPPIAFLIPPTHFWHYTRFEIKHVTKGEMIEYYDPLDKYSFAFPNTRQFDQPPLSYGSVNVSPSEAPDVTISVERWQP